MAIYTVHVPEAAPDLVTQADRTVFVREGFSLRAFVFGLMYLLWHRLWLAAVVWVVLLAGIAALSLVIHPPLVAPVALLALMHLYAGAEGPDLVRWGLSRRGLPMQDLVSAQDLDAAEAVFFARQPLRAPTPRPVPRAPHLPEAPGVIGLFPDAGTP